MNLKRFIKSSLLFIIPAILCCVNVFAASSDIVYSSNFENGIFGWNGYQSGDGALSLSEQGAAGTSKSACFRVSESGHMRIQHNITGLVGGERLTLRFYVRIDDLAINSVVAATVGYFGNKTETETFGWEFTERYYSIKEGEWQQKEIELVVPDEANRIHLQFSLSGQGIVYFDEIEVSGENEATFFKVMSGGLELDKFPQGIGGLNLRIHCVPRINNISRFVSTIHNENMLTEIIGNSEATKSEDSGAENIRIDFDASCLNAGSKLNIFHWQDMNSIEPISEKMTFPTVNKVCKNEVFDYFTINRMRGLCGGLNEIYATDLGGIMGETNTLILNILGNFGSDGDLYLDLGSQLTKAYKEVLDDVDEFVEKTGKKVFLKISYAGGLPVANNKYRNYHPGVSHDLNFPCPLSEEYWQAQIIDVLTIAAPHSGVCGAVIDLEMYSGGGTTKQTRYSSPCVCDSCVEKFNTEKPSVAAEVLKETEKEQRQLFLKQKGLYDEYAAWQKTNVTRIANGVRTALQEINPQFILGYMPQIEWLAGVTEGLGTEVMPAIIFSEVEYRGNVDSVYGNASVIKAKNLPAVYVTGLWANESTAISVSNITEKAVEAAVNSLGYWIYSSGELRNGGKMSEYVSAIDEANKQLEDILK